MIWLYRILAVWTILAIGPAIAQTRIMVVRDESVIAQQTAEQLSREVSRLGWSMAKPVIVSERNTPDLRRENNALLVALGARALSICIRQANGRPVVAALVSHPALEEILPINADRWSVILLDQPIDRWLNLIQIAFPGRTQIGLLIGPSLQKSQRQIERRFQERKKHLIIEAVSSSAEAIPAMERLVTKTGLVLALPDPVAHNRNTVQPLLLTTYRARIPVLAYSESYQQAGATVSLYSTVPQVTYQIVDSITQLIEGRIPANIQSPRYYSVGINAAAARSLGLQLPTPAEVQDHLRTMEQ